MGSELFGDEYRVRDRRSQKVSTENPRIMAVAAGDMVAGETDAAQGTSGDGDGVGGDTAATRGIAEMEWAKMSKSQRKGWLRRNKK